MLALIVIILCVAAVVSYVVYCVRKDHRFERDRLAVATALSPGLEIREMTMVRPNPIRTRRLANRSQSAFTPLAPDDFAHVSTDYGTYTPASVETSILERADTEIHHPAHSCVEAPMHDTCSTSDSSFSDTCSTSDSSFGGGFD